MTTAEQTKTAEQASRWTVKPEVLSDDSVAYNVIMVDTGMTATIATTSKRSAYMLAAKLNSYPWWSID